MEFALNYFKTIPDYKENSSADIQ